MIAVTPATPIHNAQVLQAVPPGSRKILEIGTGSGALAREVRKKCPAAEYIGVEISQEYAQLGAPHCTRMYTENFEQASGELLRELADTDVVIFADVLEHFMDPWAVLKRLRDWMPAGARVIACIPNMQHWSVQFSLLQGHLRYAESGLLDRTHLRFFTRQTMVEMFQDGGYRIEGIVPRIFEFPNQAPMLERIAATARLYGLDPLACANDAAVFQFVFVAASLPGEGR